MRSFVLALALIVGAAGASAAGQPPSTGDLLDRYARGDFAAFAAPKTASDLDRFRQALEHDGEAWARGGDARTQRRRQLIVATIAVQTAHASIELEWSQGRRLLEWAAALLRKGAADEGERRWQLAALSVMQGANDHDLVIQQQKLAWPRFPEEPRLLLAMAVALEASTWPDTDRNQPWEENDAELQDAVEQEKARRVMRQPPDRSVREKVLEYERRTRVRQAIQALEDLSNAEAIRAESLLRLGYLHLRLHNFEIAAEQFEDVLDMTRDPFLVYLAKFLQGTASERQGDRANAEAAYRAALAVAPRAQSASFALASLVFLGSGRAEAAALVEAAVSAPVADDPWRGYQRGDFRFWPERLAALREVLR